MRLSSSRVTAEFRMSLPDFPPRFDSDIVRPYWQALERGELHLPACSRCGAWQWYPFEFVRCHADAGLEWKRVSTEGTVFTFTRVHRAFLPDAGPDSLPYVVGLIELDGVAGVRIPALLIGSDTPKVGMRVRLSPQRRSTYTAPAFEPEE